jgi:hypothetical protein
VLGELVGEDVQVVRDALGVLCLFAMARGAGAKLEARGEALQPKNVFQREERSCFGVIDHDWFPDHASVIDWVAAGIGPPMHSTYPSGSRISSSAMLAPIGDKGRTS